jgi:hypothetical protein
MKLYVQTLALDAMPWIAAIFAELNRLTDIDWTWSVVEGAAMPNGSTNWIARQAPRLSLDGTTEFMEALADCHPRVRYCSRKEWASKDAMCAAAIEPFTEPGVLLQVDGDELHSADQLRRIVHLFEDDPQLMNARFHCRYFVGPNLITTDAGKPDEWRRAWRYAPGMQWVTHEPPNLAGNRGRSLSRQETTALGLVFDHYAYGLPKHVAQKEKLYGAKYAGAMAGWVKLQANTKWPLADAGRFVPAFKGTPVDRVFEL